MKDQMNPNEQQKFLACVSYEKRSSENNKQHVGETSTRGCNGSAAVGVIRLRPGSSTCGYGSGFSQSNPA